MLQSRNMADQTTTPTSRIDTIQKNQLEMRVIGETSRPSDDSDRDEIACLDDRPADELDKSVPDKSDSLTPDNDDIADPASTPPFMLPILVPDMTVEDTPDLIAKKYMPPISPCLSEGDSDVEEISDDDRDYSATDHADGMQQQISVQNSDKDKSNVNNNEGPDDVFTPETQQEETEASNDDDSDAANSESTSLITPVLSPDPVPPNNGTTPKSGLDNPDNPTPTFDKKKDIVLDVCCESYKNWLASLQLPENIESVRTEIFSVVRRNHPCKLGLLCEFLEMNEMSLSSCDIRGGHSKETVLSLAVVKNSHECAEILIDNGGFDLIKKAYAISSYQGATALHLAIIQGNQRVIEYMLANLDEEQKRTLLHMEVKGSYLQGTYKSTCQPLSLAAALGNMTIFDILVEQGADLWSADCETGNTVLHNLAIIAAYSPYHAINVMTSLMESLEVQRWWEHKRELVEDADRKRKRMYGFSLNAALFKVENNNGHTPFTYAAAFGATKFAEAILNIPNLYIFPQWSIGPTKYSLYEMNEIDPAVPVDKLLAPLNKNKSVATERASALESFAFIIPDDQLEFGNLPAVQKAMTNKWNSYRWVFYVWMALHFLVMVCFTTCIQYRDLPSLINNTEGHDASNSTDVLVGGGKSAKDHFILVLEYFVLFVSIFYFLVEIWDISMLLARKRCSSKGYMKSQKSWIPVLQTVQFDLFRVILFIFSLSVLIVLILRITHSVWQDLGYAVAAVCGWTFMLFFTRAFENIGIFTVMLERMITRELVYFTVVFMAIMAGFGTATYCLFQESLSGPPAEVGTIHQTLFSHFRLLVGLEELAIASESRLSWMVKIFFISFVLLSNILLLNMLIAAMSNTYTQMDSMKKLLWMKMRTKAVLMIERRLPRKWRSKCNLEQYGRDHQWFIGTQEIKEYHPLARGINDADMD